MANAFEIQVKAILESTDITQRLKEIQDNLKPLKIDLNLGGSGSGSAAGIQGQMNVAKSATESLGTSVTNLGTKLQNTYSIGSDGSLKLRGQIETVKTGFNGLEQTISKVDEKTGQLNATTLKTSVDGISGAKNYAQYLEKEAMAVEKLNNQEAKISGQYQAQLEKNAQSIESLKIRVEGLTDAQRARINAEERLAKIGTIKNIQEQKTAIQGFTKDLSAVSYGMMNFASSIDYTVKRFMEIGAITLVFRTIKNAISGMVQSVSDLDASLVEVQKVTDLSGKSLEIFTSRAYKTGAEVARTGKEVIDATAIFARSGYEIEDALNLSKVAMVMMNVGDGIKSVEDASTSLIAVLKGYNLEASNAIDVTNLINEVSNNAAINFSDLTEGLTRTSAVFNQAGVSIENLTGLLTGAQEILQNIKLKIAVLSIVRMYRNVHIV